MSAWHLFAHLASFSFERRDLGAVKEAKWVLGLLLVSRDYLSSQARHLFHRDATTTF